ncbi:MAG: hypothetical protein R3A80_10290 [Bdellovibrionota bacterium]
MRILLAALIALSAISNAEARCLTAIKKAISRLVSRTPEIEVTNNPYADSARGENQIIDELSKQTGSTYKIIYMLDDKLRELYGTATLQKTPYGTNAIRIQAPNGVTHEIDLANTRSIIVKITDPQELKRDPKELTQAAVTTLDPNGIPRRKLADILAQRDTSPFQNPEIYEYFANNTQELSTTLNRWYADQKKHHPKEVAAVFDNFEIARTVLPSRLLSLFIDPGIAARSPEFLKFAQEEYRKNPSISSLEMRNLFSNNLGKAHVYRALLLSPNEAIKIKENGMNSTANAVKVRSDIYFHLFSPSPHTAAIPQDSPHAAIYKRNGRVNVSGGSILMSHSLYPEVAASVAYHSNPQAHEDAKKLYLFELEIPQLDLIYETGLLSKDSENENITFQVGDIRYAASDPGIEIFSWTQMPPSQILGYKEITDTPPNYMFRPN